MLTFNQAVWPLLDDAAARWGVPPLDRWGAALAGFLLALVLCLALLAVTRTVGARRYRAQRQRLRERLLGRGRLEPS